MYHRLARRHYLLVDSNQTDSYADSIFLGYTNGLGLVHMVYSLVPCSLLQGCYPYTQYRLFLDIVNRPYNAYTHYTYNSSNGTRYSHTHL
jgi:hypothetical protein